MLRGTSVPRIADNCALPIIIISIIKIIIIIFFNLLINILLITIKTILKTCSINKNVFTSKKSVGKT